MSGFGLEITLHSPKPDAGILALDQEDSSTLHVSTATMTLAARKSPEIGFFYLERQRNNGEPSAMLMILGHLVYTGKVCSNDTVAASFLDHWRKDAKAALNELDGSFLLVVHEVLNGQTSLVSDPFGSRPLWYVQRDGTIHLGTDPVHVAERGGMTIEPDPAWVWSMLHFRRTVGEHSSVKGVSGLPSGSILQAVGGAVGIETWYDYAFAPEYGKDSGWFGQVFYDLVHTHIARTCAGNAKPALLLSGGLDSRLLASCCSTEVQCVTLCDSRNREVELACRVAEACGLPHEVIERPVNWYPDVIEESCRLGGGVWLWDQAHFLPLPEHGFSHDATLVGYGADTFFKGNNLSNAKLWVATCGRDERIARAMDLLEAQPPKVRNALALLDTDYAEVCRQAFLATSYREFEIEADYCEDLPDLWQQFWNRNLARATALMNLVSLRGFTRERNVFTTVAMRRFYQMLPAELRRSGLLPIMALKAGGHRDLLAIPDANTWLPYTFPAGLHTASARARRTIALARKKMRSRSMDGDFRSKGSWPHNGRLWLSSDRMADLFQGFLGGAAFKTGCFDSDMVIKCWTDHVDGVSDYSGELDFLATFGCVFRNVVSR